MHGAPNFSGGCLDSVKDNIPALKTGAEGSSPSTDIGEICCALCFTDPRAYMKDKKMDNFGFNVIIGTFGFIAIVINYLDKWSDKRLRSTTKEQQELYDKIEKEFFKKN